jgi:hypothetical protein
MGALSPKQQDFRQSTSLRPAKGWGKTASPNKEGEIHFCSSVPCSIQWRYHCLADSIGGPSDTVSPVSSGRPAIIAEDILHADFVDFLALKVRWHGAKDSGRPKWKQDGDSKELRLPRPFWQKF